MTMKSLALLAAIATQATATFAQPTERELRQRRAEKLSSAFVAHVAWERSWDRAMERARAESKLVLAYFTRSYAPCPPCMQLEGGPLVSTWWKEAARDVVPYLNVTTMLADDVDLGRRESTGGTGFPHVAFLNPDGIVLRIFRPSSEAAYGEALGSAEALHALAVHCAQHPEDRDAQVRFRIDRLRVLDDEDLFEELRGLIAQGGIQSGTRKLYREYLAHRTIVGFWNDHRNATRRLPEKEAQQAYASWSLRAYELWQQGIRPPSVEMTYLTYVFMVFEGALAEDDRETARAALSWARALAQQQPRIADQLDILQKRLDG